MRLTYLQSYNCQMTSLSLQTKAVNIAYGGMNATDLLETLKANRVQLNASAVVVFEHPNFVTSTHSNQLEVVQVSVADLGFVNGATTQDIYAKAGTHGLRLCPIEFAAYYRLAYLEQPEGSIGFAPTKHCAPSGSVTVASKAISEDDTVPKGFYLRRIENVLWLRGYHCDAKHLWSPQDVFAFAMTA